MFQVLVKVRPIFENDNFHGFTVEKYAVGCYEFSEKRKARKFSGSISTMMKRQGKGNGSLLELYLVDSIHCYRKTLTKYTSAERFLHFAVE